MNEKQEVHMVYIRSAQFPGRKNEQTEVEFARSVNVATVERRLYSPTQSSYDRVSEMIVNGILTSYASYFSQVHMCVSYINPVSEKKRDKLIDELVARAEQSLAVKGMNDE